MIICYLRSSSVSTYTWCAQKYYLNYVLGYEGKPKDNKADKGSIIHKLLQSLANYQLCLQTNKTFFEDDAIGKININQQECSVENLFDKSYKYYSELSPQWNWSNEDRQQCWEWAQHAITCNDGRFDPRNNTIFSPEQHFDLEIPYDWADYEFVLGKETIKGKLRIKGTIDLLEEIDKNTLHLVDYKTGRAIDWLDRSAKDAKKLSTDKQLWLYYYAARKLYPDKNIIVSIVYFNDTGATTLSFDDKTIQQTEEFLRKTFEDIKGTIIPRKNVQTKHTYKLCCQWCECYNNRDVNGVNICDKVHESLLTHGIAATTEKFMQNRKNLTTYSEGGGSKNHEKKHE